MKRQLHFLILLIPLLVACGLVATPEPDPVLDPNWTPPSGGAGQSGGADQPCAWTFHSDPLPEHTQEVSDFLTEQGYPVVDVRATAFGENCNKGGEVTSFAAFSTEYSVELSEDGMDLEAVAAEIITLLITEFPADTTPGPNPGTMTLTLSNGADTLELRADGRLARNAVDEGLTGLDLLEAVGYEPTE